MSSGSLRDLLTQLPNLDGVSISAETLPDGRLKKIGSEYEKAIAARFEKALPRIHTLVFAEEQRPDVERTHHALLRPDPHAEFRILFAPTFVEAVAQIVARRQNCFGQVCDFSQVLGQWHPRLVGRGWLLERVQAFLDDPASGYLLLIAAPGYGKSALIAELIRAASQPVAYHFLKRGQGDWDEPERMLRSLVAQLRMIFAQPIHESEKGSQPRDLLPTVLRRVSRCLEPGQRAILLIDGLDEAFGPDGRFAGVALSDVLPQRPPLGIKVVLTSRPGPHLAWLADPSFCQSISLEAADAQNQADILLYLREENAARALGLDEAFLRQLAAAAEGCFAAAVVYLCKRPNLGTDLQAWQQDPSQIPHGLVGWLEDQWTRLENPLGPPDDDPKRLEQWRRRPPPPPPVIQALLGLMASAREPLSADHLAAFLAYLDRPERQHAQRPAIGTVTIDQVRLHLEAVLALAEGFFAPRDPRLGCRAQYRFFHTSFPEFILHQKLNVVEREDCERTLAEACGGWADYCGDVQDYALRHRVRHWLAARRPEKIAETFADVDFIVARLEKNCGGSLVERRGRFGRLSVYGDAFVAAFSPNLPAVWQEGFAKWASFLGDRIQQVHMFPAAYAQEVVNEFLPFVTGLFATTMRSIEGSATGKNRIHLRKVSGPPALTSPAKSKPLPGTGFWSSWIRSVSFSPDGHWVASGDSQGTVRVWEATTGRLLHDWQGHDASVTSVSASAGGRWVASAGDDGRVRIWEVATGQLLHDYEGHRGVVWSVSFSPNGLWVASAGWDGTLMIWEAATGRLLHNCQGHPGGVLIVSFSSDARLVGSGDGGGKLKIWEAATGRLLHDWQGHPSAVRSVSFSPDGRRLASGDYKGRLKIWEAATGRLLHDWQGHPSAVRSVSFSPDGRRLASGGDGRCIRLWELGDARLQSVDCLSVAFFDDCLMALKFLEVAGWPNTVFLLVADIDGRVFKYRLLG